jgi:hypothetical protein
VISLQWQIIAMPPGTLWYSQGQIHWVVLIQLLQACTSTDHPEFLLGGSEDPSVFWAYQVLPPCAFLRHFLHVRRAEGANFRRSLTCTFVRDPSSGRCPWARVSAWAKEASPVSQNLGFLISRGFCELPIPIVSVNTLTFVCYIAKHQLWMLECWISFRGIVYFLGMCEPFSVDLVPGPKWPMAPTFERFQASGF